MSRVLKTREAGLDRRSLLRFLAGGSALAGIGLAGCGSSSSGGGGDGGLLADLGLGADASALAPDQALPADAGEADLLVRSDLSLPGDDAAKACAATTEDVLGPFHEPGAPMREALADDKEPGERIVIRGKVLSADDCATPLSSALLDLWHADAAGNYHSADEEYRLRGQLKTDAEGRFSFETIWPGRYPQGGSFRPAHIHYIISRPGYAALTTQMYFAGDPFLGAKDPCFPTCGSGDPERIVGMSEERNAGKRVQAGEFTIYLRK